MNIRFHNAVLGYSFKNNRMILVSFQGKPSNITVIQVYAPNTNAKEAEVQLFLWRLTRPSKNKSPQKRCFITGDWNAKVESQEIHRVRGKFGLGVQNEAGQMLTALPREHTGHSKHPLPTTKEMTTHGHHQTDNTEINWLYSLQLKMKKFYTVRKNKTGSWLWLRSWTPYCKIQT